MRLPVSLPSWVLLLAVWSAGLIPAEAGGWSLCNGERLAGDPTSFDFKTKTLTFHDSISDRELEVSSKDLSLRSRQRLLFSPLFHKGEEGAMLWPPEKRKIAAVALAIPMTILFGGFWIAAWFATGKLNPFLAMIGFVGSWVVLAIFVVCYAFLEIRYGGGYKIVLLGTCVALSVTPLYLAAVYNCTYGKAILVLLAHLVAGFCILSISLVVLELAAGLKRTEAWWDVQVFEPLGLIESSTRKGP